MGDGSLFHTSEFVGAGRGDITARLRFSRYLKCTHSSHQFASPEARLKYSTSRHKISLKMLPPPLKFIKKSRDCLRASNLTVQGSSQNTISQMPYCRPEACPKPPLWISKTSIRTQTVSETGQEIHFEAHK